MLAQIVDNHWVRLEQVPPTLESRIEAYFSVKHPNSRYIVNSAQQGWDGIFRKYNKKKQSLRLPLLQELILFCKERDLPLDIHDHRPAPAYLAPDPEIVGKDWLQGITLEDYQQRAIQTACEHEIGLFKFVTGAGKSEIMAGITKLFQCPTIIIAEQRIVIEQLKDRLELRNVVDEVGLFYGGETPTGQLVIVGSIQSLSTPPKSLKKKKKTAYDKRVKRAKQFQELVGKCELLLVDEADKATASNYQKLFHSYYKGRRRYGFSGTPFDPDKPVENLILKEHLGSIIAECTRQEVEATGRIIPVTFTMIVVGEDGNKQEKIAFDIAERERIIDNVEFHDLVDKVVRGFPDDKTLILIDTCNVEDLGLTLECQIEDSRFIYGKTSKKQRNEALRAFENGDLKVLIGGKILKRGLDLKGGCDNLIIIGGGKLASDFDQKIGRAVRRNDRGWARIFAFLFLNNFYLYRHGRAQLKTVLEMGYKTNVVFSDMVVDGEQFVRSRFRKPKKKKK